MSLSFVRSNRRYVRYILFLHRTPLMFKIQVFEENDGVALGGENERRRANLSLCSLFRVMIGNNHRIVERFVSRFVAFDRLFVNVRKRSSHRDPDYHLFLSGSLAIK